MTTWKEDLEQRARELQAMEDHQRAVMEPGSRADLAKATPQYDFKRLGWYQPWVEQPRAWERRIAKSREQRMFKWLLLGLGGLIFVIWALTVVR
jgi:hypothetical protein